ncbi:hypothetical protein VPH35_108475 [Triticum aestivum]
MEKPKRVPAYILTRDSGHSYDEVYSRVLAVTDQARRLYTDDTVSGMSLYKFMFHHACLLLQYMRLASHLEDSRYPSPLQRFFLSNLSCINNDIMLPENQLPWLVIEALMTSTEVDVDELIVAMGDSMGSNKYLSASSFDYVNMAPSDRPAHLLGLLRLHKQGMPVKPPDPLLFFVTSAPISAKELEGIGIKLEHGKTDKFNDMEIKKGFLFDKLFLSPLNLDRIRASWLASMVAFEVCYFVAVLVMLMVQEEDVHMLWSKGFIRGELSDKEILKFFNGFAQQMSPGLRYFKILFVSHNTKATTVLLSIIGVLLGIFKKIYSLKQHYKL